MQINTAWLCLVHCVDPVWWVGSMRIYVRVFIMSIRARIFKVGLSPLRLGKDGWIYLAWLLSVYTNLLVFFGGLCDFCG